MQAGKNKPGRDLIVYQIYPRSFRDASGDGVGDLRGVTEKLPYLKWLGVNAIWLCPFYPSPMKDNGYDISDYDGIDPAFGTMEDMETLLAAAKAQGIDVLIDMVLNHTSDRHPWFAQAVADRESPYCDYYIIRDDISGLPRLRANFGGSCWTQLPDGRWYFHTFAPEQPDLNWENPSLRRALFDMMNRWLDRGVRGFRMDAITFIKKELDAPGLQPDGPDGMTYVGRATLNRPGILDFLCEMRAATYGSRGVPTVAEAPGVPPEDLPKYIGDDGVFSMVFDFSYTDIDLSDDLWLHERKWTFAELREKLFANQLCVQKCGWAANYLENHDQPRSVSKYFPPEQIRAHHARIAKLLGTLFFFLRGTPFIYQGQELGMLNTRFRDISELDDVNSVGQYNRCREEGYSHEEAMASVNRRSRDHARTPMQWDDTRFHGFSDAVPWLNSESQCPQCCVSLEKEDGDSVLNYYRAMIRLRKDSPYAEALTDGDFEIAETPEGSDVIHYVRRSGDCAVHVAVNPSPDPVRGQVLSYPPEAKLLGSCEGCAEPGVLRPFEAAVWREIP